MAHKVKDLNRRDLSFSRSKIREALPEHFQTEYPNLIKFLEVYYEFMEGEDAKAFKTDVNNLFVARDAQQSELEYLDNLIYEIGNGLKSSSFFANPRLMATLLSQFYRVKGSLNSAEGFFRGFFGQEVQIEYPKNQMFIVGESEIGYESLKFIQNNGLYQVFSILIKSGLAVADYIDLYKTFVHPAGFFFLGQLAVQAQGELIPTTPGIPDPLESDEGVKLITEVFLNATLGGNVGGDNVTAIIDSIGGTGSFRVRVNDYIPAYADYTVSEITAYYGTIAELLSPNSFTFDDSTTSLAPLMSMTFETMDNDMFTRYTSDSTY